MTKRTLDPEFRGLIDLQAFKALGLGLGLGLGSGLGLVLG